jgi:hypothetical protein
MGSVWQKLAVAHMWWQYCVQATQRRGGGCSRLQTRQAVLNSQLVSFTDHRRRRHLNPQVRFT